MGKAWDELPPGEDWARECLRVLKPGGHMLAFGGTRTWHRLACAIEDAGFEVRDSIAWMYGSGFPKSLDVSKAIDKAAGAEREVVGRKSDPRYLHAFNGTASSPMGSVDPRRERADHGNLTAPATPDAECWQGWGTALKPAFEPIVVGRKPLAGTVAANVLAHGTGALNVDGCRVAGVVASGWATTPGTKSRGGIMNVTDEERDPFTPVAAGRWPANVILDESQAVALDEQSGESLSRIGKPRGAESGDGWGMTATGAEYDDVGGASRFFYVAKADASERVRVNGTAHPTVKPLSLMRWLVRLVTPPGGIVLEPFAGSGTTVEACILEGFRCIAIEREADYLPLIVQRINRRRDPVEAVRTSGEDGGLFDLLNEETA
jgi:site-specific DNA-methyltransferase (adenine-specific)